MAQKIDIQSIRNETIDKACEWLSEHFDDSKYWGRDYVDFTSFIEDFKKAITEQKR